jgi:hypothetical protein
MSAPKLKPSERRSERRATVGNTTAFVDRCDGSEMVLCCIWDLSASGVCLMVPPDLAIPHEFNIQIDGRSVKASVVWRQWSHVGARFVE